MKTKRKSACECVCVYEFFFFRCQLLGSVVRKGKGEGRKKRQPRDGEAQLSLLGICFRAVVVSQKKEKNLMNIKKEMEKMQNRGWTAEKKRGRQNAHTPKRNGCSLFPFLRSILSCLHTSPTVAKYSFGVVCFTVPAGKRTPLIHLTAPYRLPTSSCASTLPTPHPRTCSFNIPLNRWVSVFFASNSF